MPLRSIAVAATLTCLAAAALASQPGGLEQQRATSAPAVQPAPTARSHADGAPSIQVETLPRGAPAGARLPTVIALHGRGGDAKGFAGFVRRLAPRARIVSLQAPTALNGGYTWMMTRVAHRDVQRVTADIQSAVRALRPRLRALLTDPRSCGRPVLIGYSQGGVLALALAAEGASGFGALVDLAGALPARYPVRRSEGVRVVSIHATGDPIVPIAATRQALEALRAAGVEVVSVEVPGGHDPSDRLRAEATAALQRVLRLECPASGEDARAPR